MKQCTFKQKFQKVSQTAKAMTTYFTAYITKKLCIDIVSKLNTYSLILCAYKESHQSSGNIPYLIIL